MQVTLGYRGNAQSVLVCCWRCMKEVILLISTIIDMCNGNSSLSLTHDQVCQHFYMYNMHVNDCIFMFFILSLIV